MNRKQGKSTLSKTMAYLISCAMLVSNVSPAYAASDITIDDFGSGSLHYISGYANTDYLYARDDGSASPSDYTQRFSNWVGDPFDDTLTMNGGALNTYGLTQNGALYANSGNITVNSGQLNIASGSYISDAANLSLLSGSLLVLTGGNVTINAGDSINSGANITAFDGNLSFTGGTHYIGSGSSIASNLNITDGTVEVANANSLQTDFSNAGNLTLAGGTQAHAISGTGNVAITGDVTNTGTISQTDLSNTSTFTNNGTVNANLTNAGVLKGTGNITTKTGASSNTDALSQTNLTNNGTFDNNGQITLAGSLTNNEAATFNTNAGLLASANGVSNAGILNFTGGTNTNVVTGDGTLNVTGDLENQESISQKDITVASGKVVTTNASNMTASDAITNDGIINYTAGTTANIINGNGRIDVTGYVTNSGDIDQTTVSNSGVFTNNGTVDAKLVNTNAIEGTGSITTKAGVSSNSGTIEQDSLTNNGTFDNNGHITLTGALTNNSTFNTHADLVSAAGGIDNQSALNITGGTNKNVITGGGTTSFTNNVTNSAAITQALVNNSGNLTNNALITADVVNSGTLTSNGANINGAIGNTGSYVITDGNNANDIIGAGGTTSILGDTTNTGTIMQESLKIANSGSFTTDAESVVASVTNDGRLTWNAGAANENVINGSGQLDITGGDIVNSASIKQNKIKIAGGSLTSDADLLASTNGITNNVADGLTLTGGTNSNVIDGTGSMSISGDVTNQAAIGQDSITVSNGTLTTAADLLTAANGITNNSAISFTGGDNNNEITGTGTTLIDGTVQNLADVYTKVQVNTGAHYGTATDVQAQIDNRGTTDLIDVDILAGGKISGTGTTNILGDTVNNNSISQSALNIAAGGSLTTNSQSVEAAVTNDGNLIWNAGNSNDNVISGSGALNIAGGNITNNAAISQGSISITGGSLTSNADLLASVAGITNDTALTLNGGTNTNDITGTGALTTQGEVTNQAAIDQTTLINDGTLLNAGTIKANVTNNGNLASDADDIEGNIANEGTYAITDGDNTNNITGEGDLQILGKTANNATIHQDTITINTGATLVAANMGNITTSTKIDNAGVFEMQGGTNSNVIEGDFGALKVTGAVTNTSGVNIKQDNLDIATLGSLTADADDLKTVNGITNAGALTLGNGTTANAISGSGKLTIASGADVTNTGNIDQKSLTNNGTFTSKADLLAFANGIANSNTLNLTGGTNNNVITDNTGTTNFTGDVINNGAIEQAAVTNDTGVLTNNAAIDAAFTNNGGTVNNEAAITGAITNTGTINSTADNLNGAVTNDGTLNVAGGLVKGDITTTVTDSTMNITDNLINDYSIEQATVYNTAHFTNRGAITADLDNEGMIDNTAAIVGNITNHNNGTIDSSADYLQGPIANDGTLNIAGGTMQDVVTGSGEMNIIDDLNTNDFTIEQGSVTNDAVLTNTAAITATTITNNGTIKGKAADLIASGGITNDGILEFNAASTGVSAISGAGNVEVTANTTLTGSNTYTGTTLIDGADLTIAGQNNIGSGDVLFANNGLLIAAGSLSNNLRGNAATEDVLVQNDAALTLNGTIGSAADFRKSGAGTMTLAMASNNYTGSTYVDEGTLVGNTQNIKNTVKGAADTTVEFTDTTDAVLNEIDTLGNFVQSGSAVLNISDNAFSAKQADINAGTFAANRDVTVTTALNVNDGATLRGNGNISGTVNVNNGGTIAPGNSIDTLTITGDVNFASGSTTAIEINETPASDKLVITGNANIASGANLAVSNENGRYFEWKSFEIVDAGNVAGEFTYDGTITDYDASRIDVEVDYSDPTKVVLLAKRKATDYTGTTSLSRNQSEVARAIDAVSTGYEGDITNALLQYEQLGGLNPQGVTLINAASTLQSALDDTDGVLYANSALTPLFNAKTAHVYDRIAKRNPSAGKCSTCHDNVWAEYYSQYDKVYADANSPRFTNNMTGVLVGYDRSSDEALLGVYGGAGKSDLRQQNDAMDIDDVSLGIYGGYRPGNWVLKGTLFGGYQTYHGKRRIDFMARNAEGKYHGLNMALDLEGGYNIAVYDWLNLKPFAGVLGNYTHLESFTETGAGALNLHVESKNQFNTQARLGVQLEGKIGKRFNWYGSAAVKQFIGGDYAKLHMSLDLPGTRMEIISAELGRTYFSGQVGVSYALTNHWTVFGNLDTGVNNKSANCYGNVGLAYAW
ncbi:MAG: autotransporter-associated beta strand repeat-containing protein [Elusimicrobiaceae bacterium]|nr:autotransporter-associated beta strand repeat-containing protein [Elusimicrobiaceae bacterium]